MFNLTCNICSSKDCNLLLTTKFNHIFKCKSCGLVFAFFEAKGNNSHYSEDYYLDGYLNDKCRTKRIQQAKERIKQIKSFQEKGRLLDIGCGIGDFLKLARDTGFQAEGIEASDFAQGYCQNLGLKVYLGELASLNLPEDSYDCITMLDFIEHVFDPKACIAEARRLLEKGGLLVLKTPNVSPRLLRIIQLLNPLVPQTAYLLYPPKHFYYFTPSTLTKLIEICGLKILKILMVDELKKRIYHKVLIKSLIKRAYFNGIKNYLQLMNIKESFVIFAQRQ